MKDNVIMVDSMETGGTASSIEEIDDCFSVDDIMSLTGPTPSKEEVIHETLNYVSEWLYARGETELSETLSNLHDPN